jgi:gas vesicle protein
MNSVSKVAFGALAGAAAGAIVAWLFATDEGAEVIDQLATGSRDLAGSVQEKLGDLRDTVVDKFDSVTQSAGDLLQQGKDKAGDLLQQGKDKAADLVSNVK